MGETTMGTPNWTNDDGIRDDLLDGLAHGLVLLEKRDEAARREGRPRSTQLVYVDAAFLDAEGKTLTVSTLTRALGWVADRVFILDGGVDISSATEIHVREHAGPCMEPGCADDHREPSEDEDESEDAS